MPNLRAIASRSGFRSTLVGADHLRRLDHVQADAAQAEHDHVGARLDLGREDDGADAGGDAAADVADLVERRVVTHLGQCDLRHHDVVGERRRAHVVVDRLAVQREARGRIRHQAAALRAADRLAQIGLLRQAEFALAAFRRVQRDDVVILAQAGDARADIDHDAGAFMAENGREDAFRVRARQGVVIGMANAGGLDFDQHLARLRAFELDFLDRQRFPRLPCNRCLGFHVLFLNLNNGWGMIPSRWMRRGRQSNFCRLLRGDDEVALISPAPAPRTPRAGC
jgi:hypothetical protein